jgi:menaquinone-specific isochorismate synthase
MITDTAPIYSLAEAKEKLAQHVRALPVQRLLFTQSVVYRIEVNVEETDVLLWLSQQNHTTKIFWEDRNRECTVAAVGAADVMTAKPGEGYGEFTARLQKKLSSKFPNLRYYGGFSFNPNYAPQAEWANWDRARFVLPLIELRRSVSGTTLSCNILLNRDSKNTIHQACTQLVNLEAAIAIAGNSLTAPYQRMNFPDEPTWKASVAHIINGINEGKYEKLVLARAVKLDFTDAVNPFALMNRLRTTVSNCFSFIFQFEGQDCFLGTSPERLYHRRGNFIATEALAGTRPRAQQETDDSDLQDQLLHSAKDRSEQHYVVDMIRKNLTPLCAAFRSDDEPSLLKWSAGHHLITRFDGTLKKGIDDASLIANLHPTPAVAGSPAKEALKALSTIEKFDRGWYCGPIGYISPDESEFAVAIRCGLIKNRSLYLYAGAGIIKESLPQSEWEETEGKLSNFFKIFDVDKK